MKNAALFFFVFLALQTLVFADEISKPNDIKLVIGKWSTTFYGFVEADTIFDTTQSFNDLAGNAQVNRPGSSDGRRFTLGVRNSRFGFQVNAPEFYQVKASGQLEFDLFANEPAIPAVAEGSFFTNTGLRVRQANFSLKTPIVDVLFGQSWGLFGWQPYFQPNSVEIQGLPGQVFWLCKVFCV